MYEKRVKCALRKLKEQALEDLTASFYVKRNNIVRQAIQADPMLIEKAGERVETYHPRKRLEEYGTATEAYQGEQYGQSRNLRK